MAHSGVHHPQAYHLAAWLPLLNTKKVPCARQQVRVHHLRDGQDGVDTAEDQEDAAGSAFAKWKAFTDL